MIEKVTDGAFESIAIEFTNTPKHEVSYGLLVDKFGATDLNVKKNLMKQYLVKILCQVKIKLVLFLNLIQTKP